MTTMKEEKYTGKFSIPPFEPSDADYSLNDCIDVDRYVELLKSINQSLKDKEITESEARFLKICASRWIKFHYSKVAQWYATKASSAMKDLLEKSAMILIDLDKATEYGIIKGVNYVDRVLKRNISDQSIDSWNEEDEADEQDDSTKSE